MLNPLKLRSRILLGYSVPLLLSVGFAAVVSWHTQTVQQKVQANATEQNILAASERIVDGISQMQRSSASFLVNPNADFLVAYEKGAQELAESADYLDRQMEHSQQRARLKKIRDLANEVDTLNRYLIQLTQGNKTEQAIRAFGAAESHSLSAELMGMLEDFIAVQNQLQISTAQETQVAILALNHWLWVGSATLGMVAIAVSAWLAQRIADTLSDRINALQSLAKEITHGVLAGDRATSAHSEAFLQTSTLLQDLTQSCDRASSQAESTTLQVEQISAKIDTLTMQIAQIYQLADRVSELAERTNLLALNAGVEATRPGWHCHCFNVVATKMRTLALDSQKSAQQVNALVVDMEKGSSCSGVGISATSNHLESLQNAIASICTNVREISQESQESAIALRQVIEGVDERYQSTREAVNGISETKISLKKLNIAANHFQELL